MNLYVSSSTILVGDRNSFIHKFDENKLNNILKNLYETNFFSNIRLNLENGLLKIELVENPIIEKINILKEADYYFINHLRKYNLYHKIWQAYAALLPVDKSVEIEIKTLTNKIISKSLRFNN